MSDDQGQARWLRPHEAAKRWGVNRTTVPAIAERYGVRSKTLVPAPGSKRTVGERRYHSGDVEEALRQMHGAPAVSDAATRLSPEPGQSIWEADPGTAGRDMKVTVEVFREQAGPRIAELLGVEPGTDLVVRARVHFLEDRPAMLSRSHLPATIAGGTRIEEEDTGPGGIQARLAELGHKPVRWIEDTDADAAGRDEAQALGLQVHAPVHTITRVAWDAGDRAVEVNDMVAVPGVYPPRRYRWDA